MATKPINTSFAALDAIDSSKQALEDELAASPTAYTDNVDPTKRDLLTQVRLKEIQASRDKLISQRIKDKWYGPSKPEETATSGTSTGILSKGLDLLSKPLYGVVGAAKYATGSGKGNLLQSIAANMSTEKETFGDLIKKKTGTPGWLSAPMGFMLDVAFDPVNWVSGGMAGITKALIPKIGYGLLKEGVRGGALGAIARGAEMATATGKFIPGFKASKLGASLGEKAIKYGEEYNKAIGFDALKEIEKNASRVTMGDRLQSAVLALPHGEKLLETFQYFPSEWQRLSELADKQKLLASAGKPEIAQGFYEGVAQAPLAIDIKEALGSLGSSKNISGMKVPLPQEKNPMIKQFSVWGDEVERLADNTNIIRAHDSEELAGRWQGELQSEAKKEKLVSDAALEEDLLSREGETGIKWYDNMMSSVRKKTFDINGKQIPVYAKILNALEIINSVFKLAKTSLNPGTYVNATMGNPIMAMMYGVDVTRKEYAAAIKNAFNFTVREKNTGDFLSKFANPEIKEYMAKHADTFQKSLDIRPEEIGFRQAMDGFMSSAEGNKLKTVFGNDSQRMRTEIEKIAEEMRLKSFGKAKSEVGTDFVLPNTPVEDMPTSMMANEMTGRAFSEFKNSLREASKQEGAKALASKAFLAYLEKPAKVYQKVDQTFKLGTFIHLAENGVSEHELLKMSKQLKLLPGDVRKFTKDGQTLYRLSPSKALEATNEIYLNYAAMPAFVKMMRSVPVLNSPFISFTYGMAHKVAKTAAYNPSSFNKINFAMNEVSGQKTPLEKKAMESKYYKWYTQPGMMKIPFFQENPVYLNMVNYLPYYSMNLFTPSERKYKETIPGNLAKIIDHSPVLQSPMGQILFNYVLQPLVMSGEVPQGQFGQPMYPVGATTGQKVGYATRDLVESMVPGAAGLAGISNIALNLSPDQLEYVPSYKFRELANAVKGRNVHGDISSKGAAEKTLASLASAAGVPIKGLDLNYTTSQVKKGITK